MSKKLAVAIRNLTPLVAAALLSVAGCPVDENPPGDEAVSGQSAAQGADPSGVRPSLPKPTVLLDRNLSHATAQLAGLDGGAPRPVAAAADASGTPVEFVENELIVMTDDDGAVDAFVRRWSGEKLMTYDPKAFGLEGERYHLVRINTAQADLAQLEADLGAINPDKTGELRVSSEAGMGVLAAMAAERRAGVEVGMNFVLGSSGFADRFVRESPNGSNGETISGAAFNPDPYTWTYFQAGGRQDIGVGEAWSLLERAGKLGNKIDVAVIDGGFAQSSDMPERWTHHTNSIHAMDPYRANEMTCTNGSRCDWHGMNVVCTLAGRANNNFGAAGVAAPIVGQVTTIRLSGDVFNYLGAYGIAFSRGARIINMSYGARVPAILTPAVTPLNVATAGARAAGMLLFAAAGNDNEDVDAEDCIDPCPIIDCEICWEKAWFVPAENAGVIAVGALADNSRMRRGDSNWGNEEVDIFAPGFVWVGDDPAKQYPHVFGATSGASPFAAGVAALIWAANPAMSAGDVERILYETANTSTDGSVRRIVNAQAAVYRVLGNAPPELRITGPNPNDPAWRGFGGRGMTFSCEASDREDGTPRVVWTSSLQGVLGEGLVVSRSDLRFGRHVVTATATDSRGASFSQSIEFEYVNAPPRIEIVRPLDGLYIFAGQRFNLRAWSFDPEAFGELPVNNLAWTSNLQGFLGRGKTVEIELAQVGTHRITLTGTDADGASTSTTITVVATTPPANYPPAAEIFSIDSPNHPSYDEQRGAYHDTELRAYAWDRENGYLSGDNVSWTLESATLSWEIRIGELERGAFVRRRIYGFGAGRVTVTVTDRDGNSTSDSRDGFFEVPPR